MGKNLLSTTSLVQTPYIKVTIGKYSFGCYNKEARGVQKYPNYINSLQVTKLNGRFNSYVLTIIYVINESSDPNFFEKIFASVSDTRSIVFTYGDLSAVNFIYKEEEGIITKISSSFDINNASITYTVEAVSRGILSTTGCLPQLINTKEPIKPSEEIWRILQDNDTYGLQDLFPGMRNLDKVRQFNLIPDTDVKVDLNAQINMSVIDYLQYLVSSMTTTKTSDVSSSSFFILEFVDDVTGEFGGTYFKIVEVDKNKIYPDAYELYIGYPTANLVTNLSIENDENYSIYFKYETELHPNNYIERIDAYGNEVSVYSPSISSNNDHFETNQNDKSKWSKASEYPITLSLDIKGLLRPAILMTYVRLYIKFFSKLHLHSGIYIITKQVDTINESGYKTRLNMVRIADDPDMDIN